MATTPLSKLITSDDLLLVLGQTPDLGGSIQQALDSAIERAQLLLQTQLKTSFQPLSTTDLFYIDPLRQYTMAGFLRLRLSNGCLRSDPVVITGSSAIDDTFSSYELTYAMVDAKKGFLQLPNTIFTDQYIRVQYTSGFFPDEEPPPEIKHALLSYAPLLLFSTSSAVEGGTAPAPSTMNRARSLSDVGQDMSFPYHRRIGACADPIFSASTPLEVIVP